MLAHIKDIVRDSQAGKYAIGAFNVHNLESILGVALAAVEAGSPAIIQASEGAIKYMGLKPLTHLVSTVAKNLAANVPIALHLDHGRSFDIIFECIDSGFTSVHIDASHLPLDENIKLTKQVVRVARAKRVWVQGEVGSMIGGHGEEGGLLKGIPIANLEEVVAFAKATGVNTLAAAVGTAHGIYRNEDIDFKLLKKIKQFTKLPFVLHGGSGICDQKIKKAIKDGVDVINIGTDIKVAFSKTLIKTCRANSLETDPRKLLEPTKKAVKEVVITKMKLFGSAGRIKVNRIET